MLTTGHLSSRHPVVVGAEDVTWGVMAAGLSSAGATPGQGPPPAAWRGTAVLRRRWPPPRAGEQLTVRISAGVLHCWRLTRGCWRVSLEDAHSILVGVLRTVPVAVCVRVSSSVGREI